MFVVSWICCMATTINISDWYFCEPHPTSYLTDLWARPHPATIWFHSTVCFVWRWISCDSTNDSHFPSPALGTNLIYHHIQLICEARTHPSNINKQHCDMCSNLWQGHLKVLCAQLHSKRWQGWLLADRSARDWPCWMLLRAFSASVCALGSVDSDDKKPKFIGWVNSKLWDSKNASHAARRCGTSFQQALMW